MLQKDNIVSPGAKGLATLGIAATPLELIVPEYLERYRPGGGKLERIPA
jgi:NADH dehydrogenase